ncbi:hypothetical protein A3737_34100 [Oleiphilus sp. HI0065]|nr:hypothetical protein A3737_34100 [Oleiphilus sp. HI0065]
MAPYDGKEPKEAVEEIVGELEGFSPTLASRERWLVLNKLDMVPEEEREQRCDELVQALGWKGPVYRVSALNKEGLEALTWDIMRWIDAKAEAEANDEELAELEAGLKEAMQHEARVRLEEYKAARKTRRAQGEDLDDDDDFDEDDYDVEVEYAP